MNRCWTKREDARLRAMYGRLPSREIGAKLGRSRYSVQRRAHVLGLPSGRAWSEKDKETVRRLYPVMTGAELGRQLRRSQRSVQQCAMELGLGKLPRITPELMERVRELHAEGLHDSDIGRRLNVSRRTVNYVRAKKLSLPKNQESIREAVWRGLRTQRATLGIRNSGELRTVRSRRLAVSRGWPAELKARQVQILELLAVAGRPMTRRQIAKAIGLSADLRYSRQILKAVDGRSLLACLIELGLVLRMKRKHRVTGKGRGYSCDLYTLTPAAIDIILQRSKTCPENETA